MNIFRIAWRNLWRSRRRTLITIASVFFAVFFALIMRSLQLGAYDHMFRNIIESYTGYIQIQNEDFWDNRTVDNTFSNSPSLEKKLEATENVVAVLPRLESFALASSGNLTKGVLVMGIDPAKENLHGKLQNGNISMGEHSALIGEKLSQFLGAGPGDTIVLLGQGYHGTTAAGKFRINGIIKIPSPDLDNKIVYLPVDVCQELYNAPGMLSSLTLSIAKNRDSDINKLIKTLKNEIPSPLKVMSWRDMNKLIINQMDADNKSGAVMILILYLVIAFGVFGTVLMMTAERRREFGMLVAIGMQKTRLAAIFLVEMVYTGLLGIGTGVLVSLPVIFYGHAHPLRFKGELAKMYEDYGLEAVMPFLLPDKYMLWQSVIVAVIILIALIYPMRKISKMIVVNALKA